ncbi:1-acyl-sn-glycerol-3-phosphate acyltransferase [Sulfurovum sp. enrichment culture clone C5]|uniref:1-acyl-sn-glycerol-3-phosphate acyltransferase n=1 Tax=Sulfurovum sp. enrichment culture clone C5 TaxID=497650 RepID=A0A0S4XN47_9BACT|nr:1-acyl-sn-glycerol-3-phosphate acyltransferase [Sulfurovum sp. enrichment culture clone C5]
MNTLLSKIRFFWSAFVIFIVVAFFMIPLVFVFRKHKGIIMHKLNRIIMFLLGSRAIQVGKIDLSADMYIFNHQGIVDIIAMESLQTNHLRWMAKKELFNLPYIGQLLKLGEMISIDRESKKSILKLLNDVKYSISTLDRKVAIFPEGTRSKGQKLLSFKSGAKIIAEKLHLKIQPVVITGSRMLVDESKKTSQSSDVVFNFLPLVDVEKSSEDWYEDIQKQMQEVIDDEFKFNNRSR